MKRIFSIPFQSLEIIYVKSRNCRIANVGKSTLFNAVTRTAKSRSGQLSLCTIDPNVGIVTVPDARLEPLSKIAKTSVIIPVNFQRTGVSSVFDEANGYLAKMQENEQAFLSAKNQARGFLPERHGPLAECDAAAEAGDLGAGKLSGNSGSC